LDGSCRAKHQRCESACDRDPAAKFAARIDFVRKDENPAGTLFRAKRRPPKKAISVINRSRARRFVDGGRDARRRPPPLVSFLPYAILDARTIGRKA
jgi:hypothetical protein